MEDANPAKSPREAGFAWTKADCPKNDEERAELEAQGYKKEDYVAILAAINFVTCNTRLDNKYIQSKLATMQFNPGLKHFQALKRFVRWIKFSQDYGVQFIWRRSDPVPEFR